DMMLDAHEQDQASAMIEAILKDKPQDTDALVRRARLRIDRLDPAKAIADLESAQKVDAKIPMLHYLMGAAYLQQGNIERAQTGFKEAVNLNPAFWQAYSALGEIALRQGQLDAALQYADQILKGVPDDPSGILLKGNVLAGKQQYARSEEQFKKYVALKPDQAQGYHSMGTVAALQKRYDDAERQLNKALEIDPTRGDTLESLIGVYYAQKKSDKAEALLKSKIAANGNNALYWILLSKIYINQHRVPDAESALEKARVIDPGNPTTLSLLGNLYFSQNDLNRALAQYQKATQSTPRDPGLWTIYGMLNERTGRKDDAKAAYGKALEANPTFGIAANNLAYMIAEEGGDMDKALDLARRAKLAIPQDPAISDTLAWVYCKRKVYDSAAPLLQEVLKAKPDNATYQYHMSVVYYGQGKTELSKIMLAKALKQDSNLGNRDDVKKLKTDLGM
ncbi:MAG: tetratricopeptide repeat protein, partial [Acidobacteriales bacterium]|nr:tetratricopeptide repeat protein [Terriglobales bacterium]